MQVDRPTSDSQLLKVVLGRSPMRPASAAEGCDDDDDPPWHMGEMRPRGYSAPSSKQSSRCNNGFMHLRVVETARSSKPPPVSHALRKVHNAAPCLVALFGKYVPIAVRWPNELLEIKVSTATGKKLQIEIAVRKWLEVLIWNHLI